MSDEMDLLAEQVKMLSGEIAFSSSTLKRLMEQSENDPESSKNQVCIILLFFFYLQNNLMVKLNGNNDFFVCYNQLRVIVVHFRFSSKRTVF